MMATQVSLSVNNMPIKLDYFVHEYIEHVIGGVVGSLRDTGEIDSLELSIDNEGQVEINLNGSVIPLKEFPIEIIRKTIFGMIAPLKGVSEVNEVSRLEITIKR
jgi:hypothetical protein